MRAFYTVGYQGRTPHSLLKILKSSNISLLVDIRLNPWSRMRGFSKGCLAGLLRRNGIEYTHEVLLGTPRPIRRKYCQTGRIDLALSRYREHLRQHTDRLELVRDSINGRALCFFCLEKDWTACHRRIVAEEFEKISGMRAIHL